MRCIACNHKLSDVELLRKKKDYTQEDMCTVCLIAAGIIKEPDEEEAQMELFDEVA